MSKVGFILEGGGPDPRRASPDEQVCRYLVNRLRPDIEPLFRGLAGKHNLLKDCGEVARQLLETEKCTKVFVIWDLYPAWRENITPCRKEDCKDIQQSIKAAGIAEEQVRLICIQEELEAWLLADHKAIEFILTQRKHPHRLNNKITRQRKPDSISNPKALLTKMFSDELGRSKRYTDYQDAIAIIQKADIKSLLKSGSFSRFDILLKAV